MSDTIEDAQIISASHGWIATPWDYSSLRWLRLSADGHGELTYGYGQSIFAKIKCQWELTVPNVLRLVYLDSARYQRFKGFAPSDSNRLKELEYRLTEGEVVGVENIVAWPYKFLWTLELSASPWPFGLELPHEAPTTFYGHQQRSRTNRRLATPVKHVKVFPVAVPASEGTEAKTAPLHPLDGRLFPVERFFFGLAVQVKRGGQGSPVGLRILTVSSRAGRRRLDRLRELSDYSPDT